MKEILNINDVKVGDGVTVARIFIKQFLFVEEATIIKISKDKKFFTVKLNKSPKMKIRFKFKLLSRTSINEITYLAYRFYIK